MCGIVGYWSKEEHEDTLVDKMANLLLHRGPDDKGVWRDSRAGVILGHRRLAILDLSPTGRQPMVSTSGRFVIVYNGEVYNYQELKKELSRLGYAFQGRSDTEVILEAIAQWGLEEAVKRFVGMFAFALWDRKGRRLALVRDRLGIKPLYYGWVDQAFVFASELSPFTVFPGFRGEVDRQALALYLRHNCVPAPFCIYRKVRKVMPGHILWVDDCGEQVKEVQYWSAVKVALGGQANAFAGSDAEAIEELHYLLSQAVDCRMIADVPLGAFLSGGVDSSTVVALMQAHSSLPIKTFSIGSTDARFDEAGDAARVARYLGTDHTELYVTHGEAQEVIPKLAEIFDEPFADSSQIPTFLVCELARRKVTVALSGDGGDELFAGYNRHVWAPRIWKKMRHWPVFARKLGAGLLRGFTPAKWDMLFATLRRIAPKEFGHRMAGYKMQKLSEVLQAASFEEMYTILTSHWQEPCTIIKGLREEMNRKLPFKLEDLPELVNFIMLADLLSYLPDDILTKVDRTSMAVSLEARVPVIDHRIVEFAWQLPASMKIRNGQSKWILRQVLYRYLPRELVERPKSGFGVPIEDWLCGPLRDWAEALLDERRLHQEGFFNPTPIRQAWEEHLSGRRNRAYLLWDILMFQAWLEKFG